MCSISVEPIPSTMSMPKRSRHRWSVVAGSGSAADTQKRTDSMAPSASGSRASSPNSAGTLKNTEGRWWRSVWRMAVGLGGPANSTEVPPNHSGKVSPLPRP
jgi:hypothetical protein